MTPRRRKRLFFVAFLVVGVGASVGLGLNAFHNNLMYFYSPSQIAAGKAPVGHLFRVGGLVKKGSVKHGKNGIKVRFVLTDGAHSVPVYFKGALPDLFRVGQGIVAQGRLEPDGHFIATQVLAKHNAKYMPPNVASELKTAQAKKAGQASGRESG